MHHLHSSSRLHRPTDFLTRGREFARRASSWAALAACVAASSGSAWCQSPGTIRIDRGPALAQTNLASWQPRITADGRYVVYYSYATNLVPDDTGFKADVFVYDSHLGTTVRASVDSNGVGGNADSYFASISDDGNLVAFQSLASNFFAGDTNGQSDVFVRNLAAGTTTCISLGPNGEVSNNFAFNPAISADGRFVVFESLASNLVVGDTNGQRDIFLRDLAAGTTTLVSVDSNGVQGNGLSANATISADGRYVVFESTSTNLVPNDTNAASDVFLRDTLTGTTTRVSVDSNNKEGDGDSVMAQISPSGKLVAFSSLAENLVVGDTNGQYDLFLRDLVAGTTTRISLSSNGVEGDGGSFDPSISGNDRFVAFDSAATNLVPNDTNGWPDIFLRDLVTGVTTRVSVTTGGGQSSSQSAIPGISADGQKIVFYCYAPLVPGDTNGVTDIYLRDLGATHFTSLCDPGVGGVMACPCSNAPAGPGQGCNNSAATGGAILTASGVAYLSADSVVFTTSGEKPAATSVLLQGTTTNNGAVYGQGIRCVGGTLKRLFTKAAAGGSISVPNFGAGDPSVSARSAAKGNLISVGQSRWYLVFYRDPTVLGGCPVTSTFNATQTGRIDWSL
jgi:hypothetical protein